MKAQKLSSQITKFSGVPGILAVLLVSLFSSATLAQNYIWRGDQRCEVTADGIGNCDTVDVAAAAMERFNQEALPAYNHGPEDCEEGNYPEGYLHQVDIVGPEGREPKDRSERPYVASFGNINGNGNEVVTHNGFLPHQEVLVVNAHALIREDGRWRLNWSDERPDDALFKDYLVNVAGCEGSEAIPVQALCRIGTNNPTREPGLDYAVMRLDRSACLGDSQVAHMQGLSAQGEQQLLLSGGSNRMKVEVPAMIDPRTLGQDTGGPEATTGVSSVWNVEDVELMADRNYVVGIDHFIHGPDGGRVMVGPNYSGPEQVYRYYEHHADIDQGTSGAPVVLAGQISSGGHSMDIEYTIGIQRSERDDEIQGNYAIPYEGAFERDVEAVLSHVRSGASGCP
ncbi:MAG: hypothetical protein AAF329_20255 [Cyanobacteria bacterium P01_A01_bin.17]